jgi:hypothetical protein
MFFFAKEVKKMENTTKTPIFAKAIKVNNSVLITIPVSICEHYNIKKGDKLVLTLEDVQKVDK